MDLLERAIERYEAGLAQAKGRDNEFNTGYYEGVLYALQALKNNTYGPDKSPDKTSYPQSPEPNEYRHIDADWLDQIAAGLTAGAVKHPGESWRSILAEEHAARAMRHINLYRAGDESDDHLVNASMRCMMAYVVDREAKS